MSKWAILLYGLGISGGANVIFEHALYAYNKGVEVTIVTRTKLSSKDASWHNGTENFKYKSLDEIVDESFDIAIATEWRSAFDLCQVDSKKYFYFVQSIESRFFKNINSMFAYLANNSYELDVEYITEAGWIRDYLKTYYNKNAELIKNGIDKTLFAEKGSCVKNRSDKRRFLVEGSVSNWLKNVPKTIEFCRRAGVDELWLVTPDDIDDYPGVDCVFSGVAMEDMPAIYRSCDVLVKLSLVEGMFGPPLEMFHCGGTAIVHNVDGASEYIKDGENALIVSANDEQMVIDAITRLKDDTQLVSRLKAGALNTANRWWSWSDSSSAFYKHILGTDSLSDEKRKRLFHKADAGAKAYRIIENTYGSEPSDNRIKEATDYINKNKTDLVLYGAGALCKHSIISFGSEGVEIKAVLVTDASVNPRTVLSHKVYDLDGYRMDKEKSLIYITTEKYKEEIREDLKKRGFKHII